MDSVRFIPPSGKQFAVLRKFQQARESGKPAFAARLQSRAAIVEDVAAFGHAAART